MKIETKYNIGDIVYGTEFGYENMHICQFQIRDIQYRDKIIKYDVITSGCSRHVPYMMFESDLFESADACIKDLIKRENARHNARLKEIKGIKVEYEKNR